MCFSSFYHKIMFSAVKNAKAVLISYFHSYNSFSYAEKKKMAYVHQLLDQPSQWQTSQQAGPGSVPKFTSTSITVKQLLIKNISQSKSSLLIWHYVSYLFLLYHVTVNLKQVSAPNDPSSQNWPRRHSQEITSDQSNLTVGDARSDVWSLNCQWHNCFVMLNGSFR